MKFERCRNVIKTLEAMITCNKKQAEGYPECVKDCDDCSLLYEQGNFEERIEVLEMAIKALEQEPIFFPPCQDCNTKMVEIRRAYDKLQKPSGDAIDRRLVCAFITGLISDDGEREKGLEYIRNMPSVNPTKTGWIPVSERLPEEYGEYLITWTTSMNTYPHNAFIAICEYEVTSEYDHEHYRFKGEWLLDDYIKNYPDVKVIAWMPLPKPYRAESEDKE